MADNHVLYRFYSATGQLLYVGITMNPSTRFKQHRKTKDWWGEVIGITLEHYESRDELARAERRAIQVERPLHNVIHSKVQHKPNPKPAPKPDPVESSAVDDEITKLFAPPPAPTPTATQMFSGLFTRNTPPERQVNEDGSPRFPRLEAVLACVLCDDMGYKGMVVCDHIDRSEGGWYREKRLAERRVALKQELKVIPGGDA